MNEIIKVVIRGASGFCCEDEAYHDRLVITPEGLNYEYIPLVESEINPKRKWKYTTTSPVYREMYRRIEEMIPDIIQSETVDECTDVGGIEFQITYSDKNKVKKLFWVQGDYFADLFNLIKKIVPECEYIPAVLLTSEDYSCDE